MPIRKLRNQSTESRLLLESDEPVELPPAEVEEESVSVQFDTFKSFVPELLAALREGGMAEPVPVMMDGSTFVVHGATRSFWVKLWHSSPELTRIERAQVIGCLPSTRGLQLIVGDPEGDDYDDDDEDVDDDTDELDEDDALADDDDDADEDDDEEDDFLGEDEAPHAGGVNPQK